MNLTPIQKEVLFALKSAHYQTITMFEFYSLVYRKGVTVGSDASEVLQPLIEGRYLDKTDDKLSIKLLDRGFEFIRFGR